MSNYNNAQDIGNHNVRPSADVLATMERYDSGMGKVGHARMHDQPASFICIPLFPTAVANANAKESLPVLLPFGLKILAIDLGCLSAAGSAAVADIHAGVVGGAFATILDAPEDIKTGAGAFSRITPLTTAVEQAYAAGKAVKLIVTGTGAGDVLGAAAYLWCQRL